jgi:hypothetical protein
VVEDAHADVRSATAALTEMTTVVADAGGRTATTYGMTETPSTAFVTANGQILTRHQGTISADTLERRVRSLIAAGPARP